MLNITNKFSVDTELNTKKELELEMEGYDYSVYDWLTIEQITKLRDHLNKILEDAKTV